ncbi:hypothetical protein [Clostridium sp. FP1]|uniref:hypothetical protein n=1 Tax=Clostridium sp. FP1 TaxID=2724076 RepID=UPI0013E92994|nr:hypothetical protein [Clostridium sp. FP1]MBZ9634069.1 hypothetical protein [Clostridium sp. FP1]
MINLFFEDEEIKEDDLYFMCYMIEKVAKTLHVRNKEVVNEICNIIDNYNSSAYYEPTPIIVRSYYNSSFN